MSAMEFAVTIGFDALRIATGRPPKHHDIETICRWLRHASAPPTPADDTAREGKS
jgi:hypothetical protein